MVKRYRFPPGSQVRWHPNRPPGKWSTTLMELDVHLGLSGTHQDLWWQPEIGMCRRETNFVLFPLALSRLELGLCYTSQRNGMTKIWETVFAFFDYFPLSAAILEISLIPIVSHSIPFIFSFHYSKFFVKFLMLIKKTILWRLEMWTKYIWVEILRLKTY